MPNRLSRCRAEVWAGSPSSALRGIYEERQQPAVDSKKRRCDEGHSQDDASQEQCGRNGYKERSKDKHERVYEAAGPETRSRRLLNAEPLEQPEHAAQQRKRGV